MINADLANEVKRNGLKHFFLMNSKGLSNITKNDITSRFAVFAKANFF